jgi:hypothetical protein
MKKILLLLLVITIGFQSRAGNDDMQHDPPVKHASVNAAVLAGLWVPTGNLSLLGAHPYCGFQIGARYKRLLVNATVAFRFIKSANEYQVVEEGQLYNSHKFFGGYIGLDGGFDVLQTPGHEISVLAGCGFDGFDALYFENNSSIDDDDVTRSINSLNLNAGLGYKYYISPRGGYIGLDLKYNFLFYKNNGGTDLSGNAVTLGLIFGLGRRNF